MIDKHIIRYEELQKLRAKGVLIASEEDELREISTKILYQIMEEPEIVAIFKRLKKKGADKFSSQELCSAIEIVAGLVLKNNNIELNAENLGKECARIERCLEYQYTIDTTEKYQYNSFASHFLLDNYKEFINGNTYSSLYLNDVPDVDWVEDAD
jgi:N-acetylmuramic acid 6-phosphate (MurNAc-6-P) etherase